jgi:hypothetical protein
MEIVNLCKETSSSTYAVLLIMSYKSFRVPYYDVSV